MVSALWCPQIYSFSSGLSEGPEDIRNAPALAGPSSTQPQAVAAGLRGLAAGPAAPTQPSTTAGQAAQAGAAGSPAAAAGVGTAAAAAAAPVGSAQLVSAVKDLLGAAGLPLSVDQTELLSKAAETQAQLTSTQRELQVRVIGANPCCHTSLHLPALLCCLQEPQD